MRKLAMLFAALGAFALAVPSYANTTQNNPVTSLDDEAGGEKKEKKKAKKKAKKKPKKEKKEKKEE